MTRQQVTTMIKAKGGWVYKSSRDYAVYIIPLGEGSFLALRERIPFNTCWHGTFEDGQSLSVFFDQPV